MEAKERRATSWNVVLDQCGFSSFVPLKICLFKSLHHLKKAQKERPTEMMLYYPSKVFSQYWWLNLLPEYAKQLLSPAAAPSLCRLRACNYSILRGWASHRPLSLRSWVVEYRLVVPSLLQKPYLYEFSLLCSMKDVKSLSTLFQIVRPYTEEAGSFVDIAFLFLFL